MPTATRSIPQLQSAILVLEQMERLEQELTAILRGTAGSTTVGAAPKSRSARPGSKRRVEQVGSE